MILDYLNGVMVTYAPLVTTNVLLAAVLISFGDIIIVHN